MRPAEPVLGGDTRRSRRRSREVDEARVRVPEREVALGPGVSTRFSAFRNGVSAAPYSRQIAESGVNPPAAGACQ